jgi:hypothetical protein
MTRNAFAGQRCADGDCACSRRREVALVDVDLQTDRHAVGPAGQHDDLHQLVEHRGAHWATFSLTLEGFALGAARRAHWATFSLTLEGFALGAARRAHALAAGRRRVRVQAVAAAVCGGHGDVDELLGQRIERARRHDPLGLLPRCRQLHWIVRQRSPDVVDVVRAAGRTDIVEDGARLRIGLRVGQQRYRGHGIPLTVFEVGPGDRTARTARAARSGQDASCPGARRPFPPSRRRPMRTATVESPLFRPTAGFVAPCATHAR